MGYLKLQHAVREILVLNYTTILNYNQVHLGNMTLINCAQHIYFFFFKWEMFGFMPPPWCFCKSTGCVCLPCIGLSPAFWTAQAFFFCWSVQLALLQWSSFLPQWSSYLSDQVFWPSPILLSVCFTWNHMKYYTVLETSSMQRNEVKTGVLKI